MSASKLLEIYNNLSRKDQSMIKALVTVAPMLKCESQVPALLEALTEMQSGHRENALTTILEPELRAFGEYLAKHKEALSIDQAV